MNGDVLDELARLNAEMAALRAEQAALRALLEGDVKAAVTQMERALLSIAFAGPTRD